MLKDYYSVGVVRVPKNPHKQMLSTKWIRIQRHVVHKKKNSREILNFCRLRRPTIYLQRWHTAKLWCHFCVASLRSLDLRWFFFFVCKSSINIHWSYSFVDYFSTEIDNLELSAMLWYDALLHFGLNHQLIYTDMYWTLNSFLGLICCESIKESTSFNLNNTIT